MKNAEGIAAAMVQECRQPLGTTSVLAARPEYTEQAFQAALELAFESGRKGYEWEPAEFREAANARVKNGHLGT